MSASAGSSRESSKQRALRIPLDYYRRLTRLDRAKWTLSVIAFFVSGSYATWVIWTTVGGAPASESAAAHQLSPGPVAAAHSAWDTRCEACHEPGVPLRSDAAGSALLQRLVSSDARSPRAINDAHCSDCHAGHAHHPRQRDAEVPACAACHRDHQGTAHDIRRVADQTCVACHGQLEQHRQDARSSPVKPSPVKPSPVKPSTDMPSTASPASSVASAESIESDTSQSGSAAATHPTAPKITSLADHPPFRSLPTTDPGRIKFNHRLHLLPGQYPRNAKSTAPKRLDSIPRTYWHVLGYAADTPPETIVQLDCQACHEADPVAKSDARPANSASRFAAVPSSGDYLQPIRYDRHCASCHDTDLQVTIAVSGGSAKGAIPHGLRPAALRQQIAGIASARQAFASADRLVPPRPVPGRTSGANLAQTSGVDLGIRLRQSERELRADHRCGKCHLYASESADNRAESSATPAKPVSPTDHVASNDPTVPNAPIAPIGSISAVDAELPPDVLPASVPTVWLPKARFDHAAHRAVACQECHDRESLEWAADGKPPLDSAKPMIPGLDNCRRCHFSSGEQVGGGRSGVGARADCVECHRYHAADRHPAGAGAHSLPLPPDRQTNGRQLMPRAARP